MGAWRMWMGRRKDEVHQNGIGAEKQCKHHEKGESGAGKRRREEAREDTKACVIFSGRRIALGS
eukprot:1394425-Rhodomonas_salina.2